jgi:dTDP-4-dehydrorhamnose reductase
MGSQSFSASGSRSTCREGSCFASKASSGRLPGGPAGRGTLDGIVDGLEGGRDVRAFTDRVVSPSHVGDVAAATRHLIESGAVPGIYHCVNSGSATWYDLAIETARLLGVQGRLVPVALADMQLKAPRPRYCALANQKLADAGFTMPTWQDALGRWLAERHQDSRMNETHG